MNVLIVDDDLTIRLVLKGLLSSKHQVFTAENGIEGLGYLFVARPEVAIIDLTLPKYGGLEVLDYLKSNQLLQSPGAPKIIILHDEQQTPMLPSNFQALNKAEPKFLEKLAVAMELDLPKKRLATRVANRAINLANASDLAYYKLQSAKNVFSKSFYKLVFVIYQLLTSLCLTALYLLSGWNTQEENLPQQRKDRIKLRSRAVPALATALAGLIIASFGTVTFATTTAAFFGIQLTPVHAASVRTWDGGGVTNNWSDCANWDGPDICPVAGDTAQFNATSTKNSTVDATFGGSIGVINVNAGYSGTITQAETLAVTSTMTLSAGTYTASNQALSVTGVFTMNAGSTFTASSGTTTFIGPFTINGGTFNHNNGTVNFDNNINANYTLSCNSITFNLVTITTSNAGTKTVNSNCSFPLGNNPTIATTSLNGTLSGTGTLSIAALRNLTMNAGSSLSGFTGLTGVGTATFTLAGATVSNLTTVTFNNNTTMSSGSMSGMTTFNQVGGSLTISGATLDLSTATTANLGNISTMTAGTLTAPSGTMTVASHIAWSGTSVFNANGGTVSFNGFASSTTMTCNNATFNLVSFASSSGTRTISSNCSLPLGANPSIPSAMSLSGTLSGTGTITTGNGGLTLGSGSSLSGFSGLNLGAGGITVAGGTANLNGYSSFVSTGTVTVSSGSLSLPSGVDLNGALTISGGTFTAPSGAMTLAGNLTISGSPTFNANGGTITFDGAAATLSCNSVTFNLTSIAVVGGTGAKTVNSDCNLPLGSNPTISSVTLNGTLTGTGVLTLAVTGITPTLTLNSGAVLSGFTGFNAAVTLNGGNVVVSGATANFSSYTSFAMATSLTLNSGSLSLPNGTDLNSSLIISGGTFTAPSGTMTLAGNLTISGSPTFNANGGTITFDGGAATINCNSTAPFNLVVVAASTTNFKTYTNCTTVPLGNNPTPTRIQTSGTTTISGTGTLALSTLGDSVFNTGGTISGFTALTGSAVTIAGANLDFSSYSSVVLSSTLNMTSGSISLPNGADLNGALTISGGTFNAPSGTMTLAGNLSISGSPTFNANSGTIIFDGSGATSLSCNNVTFNLVSFNNTNQKNVNAGCNLPMGNNPTLTNSGSIWLTGGTLSGTGTLTRTQATLNLNSATGGLSGFTGLSLFAFTVSGNNADLSGYTTFVNNGAVILSSGSLSLPNGSDLNGALTISGGTFTAPSGNMTVAGNFVISGSPTYNANGGTITFDASTAGDFLINCNGANLNHAVIANTAPGREFVMTGCTLPLGNNPTVGAGGDVLLYGGEITGTGTVTTSSYFYVSATSYLNATNGFTGFVCTNVLELGGTHVDFSTYTTVTIDHLNIYGTDGGSGHAIFTAPPLMTLTGSTALSVYAPGEFLHNNGTVVLGGTNQQVIGTTFNNLTKIANSNETLTFPASGTETILGALTLQGDSSSHVLSLVSSTPGTQWNLDVSNATGVTVGNLSVKDSVSVNHVINTGGLNVTDGGNNVNWNFHNPEASNLGPTSLVGGGFVNSRTPTLTFHLIDPDVADTVKYQVQVDDSSDFSSPVVDSTSGLSAQGDFSLTVPTTLSDGNYYWRIRGIDNHNATGDWTTANNGAIAFVIDGTAPTGSISIKDDPNNSNPLAFILSTPATDNLSGLDQMIVSRHSSFSGNTWEPYAASKFYTFGSYGTKTIYIKYKDKAGNESQTYSVTIIVLQPTPESAPTTPTEENETPPTPNGMSYEVKIQVVNEFDQPILGALVTLGSGQTITTDVAGIADFKGIPAGDSEVNVNYQNKLGSSNITLAGSDKVIQVKVILAEQGTSPLIYLLCAIILILLLTLFFILIVKRKRKHPR